MNNQQSVLRGTSRAAIASILILGVSGCVLFAPSKSPALSDEMIQAHKGDFVGLYNDWIKPAFAPFNGAQLTRSMDIADNPTRIATEDAIARDFARFCRASGGTPEVQPSKFGNNNVCNSAGGESLGEIETYRYTWGLTVKVDSQTLRQEQQKQQQAAEDARRKQDYAKLLPGSVEYLSGPELYRLIPEFANDDPKNLLPKAKERQAALLAEAMKAGAERDRQRLQDLQVRAEAKRKNQENRQIGDQVCYLTSDSTAELPTGIVVMGQPQFRQVKGSTKVVGFVEDTNRQTKKIKIRISDINFSSYGMSRSLESFADFHGTGTTLRPNGIIWDDTHNWEGC